jgi:hypothetical protein
MDSADSFTALDWIAVSLSALVVVALFAFPFTVARSFARMFADFGGELPVVTRLALTPWAAPAMALVAASPTAIAVAVPAKGSLGLRRGLVVLGFLLAVAALALAMYAMYAPIFELAGKIKP